MAITKFKIRNADPGEFNEVGSLMVLVYSQLDGFPKPNEFPAYYKFLQNVGEFTKNPGTQLLIATTDENEIMGAVVYVGDMKYYGSGGMATTVKNAAGFRLLAVDPKFQGKGIGKILTEKCISLAQSNNREKLILHTTESMKLAWGMYEKLNFERFPELDFMQGETPVF